LDVLGNYTLRVENRLWRYGNVLDVNPFIPFTACVRIGVPVAPAGIEVSPHIAVFGPHMVSQPLMLRNPFLCLRSGIKLAEITRIAIWPRHLDAPIVRLHE